MAGVTHTKIDDLDAIEGMLDGVKFVQARKGLGVEAFGISIVDVEAGSDQYPEHDHSPDGIGGKMFAKRPSQLGQEEVFTALEGSGTLVTDEGEFPLDPGHIARVAPDVKRKVLPGPDGIRLLILGGTPGEAYEA